MEDSLAGGGAALAAAFLWAVGSLIWGRVSQVIPAVELNLLKIGVALVCFAVVLVVGGGGLPHLPLPALGLLVASGVIGIGIADSFYMVALRHLGARRSLLLKTLDPPCAALLSALLLQEYLGLFSWCGIPLTLAGVAWVIRERTGAAQTDQATTHFALVGLAAGVLAAVGQAVGAVLTRAAFLSADIDPAWGVFLRMLGGLAVVVPWLVLRREPVGEWCSPRAKQPILPLVAQVVIAAFIATFLGIWLQQVALKWTATGIAQALGATSPLFVLPMAAWLGEKLTWRAVLGAFVSLAGVVLLLTTR